MNNYTFFKEGHNYFGRFTCNYHLTVEVQVVKRTKKTVIIWDTLTGEQSRRKIYHGPDCEMIQRGPGLLIMAKNEVHGKKD